MSNSKFDFRIPNFHILIFKFLIFKFRIFKFRIFKYRVFKLQIFRFRDFESQFPISNLIKLSSDSNIIQGFVAAPVRCISWYYYFRLIFHNQLLRLQLTSCFCCCLMVGLVSLYHFYVVSLSISRYSRSIDPSSAIFITRGSFHLELFLPYCCSFACL